MNIALITGASGGIGSATAKRFAEAGYAVVLQYHTHAQAAQDTANTFPDGTLYLCVPCDLSDSASISEMIDTVHQRMGSVSTLVNCAGIALPQMLFSDTTDADYARIFETNVHGTIRVTKALLPDLLEKRGAIVNLSSIWGIGGGSCEVLYSTSKAAIIGFTKSLAKELAPSGVRVNCIAPGLIDTAMNAHLDSASIASFVSDTPLGRIGTADDVADAVLYLSEASFITGQILCIDGGYLN